MTDEDLSEAEEFIRDYTNIELQDNQESLELNLEEGSDRRKAKRLLLRHMIAEGDIQEYLEASRWDEMFFQESIRQSLDEEDLRRPGDDLETVECSECGEHYKATYQNRIFHENGRCQHLKEALPESRQPSEEDGDREVDPEEEIRSIREQEEFAAKTQALELLFRTLTPPHLLCENCGYDIDAWDYWKTVLLEQIERQKAMGSDHLLDQLERAHDVFFSECPECGKVADFRGGNK